VEKNMERIKRTVVAVLVVAAFAAAAPAHGGAKMTRLGSDEALDAPPSIDLTYLEIGRNRKNLEVRIGLNGTLPELRAPAGAGIEWTFDVNGKTFVAEGHPDYANGPAYTLFQVRGEVFTQIARIKGSWDADQGYLQMLVPLNAIGARRGTRISGHGPKGTEDVDIHQHAGPASQVVDAFATTKDFVVR
jgi:hypothetical protein